ncbi:hypothetical protein [Pseudomonas fulva]|uniref:hypothetical protein n=1 Tax=Pseudomonas fulva TaxID=47880 RepID=UPI002DBF7576|nr:hypothetical protein [Pseudomonas fulva]MEB8055831.1 hypothetical protein [Pseudomonas fulva]
MKFLDSIVSRLPQWALALTVFTILGFAFVLAGVAIFSERDVKFWPPEIGPGPKSRLVDEFKRFSADLDKDVAELLAQRKKLSENLQLARSNKARAESLSSFYESLSWQDSTNKLENEIKAIDKELISNIEDAKGEVRRIESKLNGI